MQDSYATAELERRERDARWIADRMRGLNVSSGELARLTEDSDGGGVHYQTIRRMIRGDRVPRDSTLRRLKVALEEVARER